jgi:signal transduction histidine kinase
MRRSQLAELEQARQLTAVHAAERARVSEMESLDRSKAELFGLLTHELMHPVAAIRGFAVTLQRRWDQLDDQERIAIVDRIEHQTVQLRDMAEEAITVTHLETQPFELAKRSESAVELAREASDMVEELDGRLKVRVDEAAEQVLVWCDRTRVLQVLRNLLSNADKYSGPETPIELRLGESDGVAVFSVSDEGPGISDEDLVRLFQRFSRIRPAGGERIPGSGLGLYICKRIVEAHEGQIWVESRPGEGTTFLFRIPKAK